jgi:MFS family permease
MTKEIRPQDIIPSPRLRAWLAKRRNRRFLVVTGALSFLAMLAVIAVPALPTWAYFGLLGLFFLLTCAHGIALNTGTQFIAASRVAAHDERQQQVWERAHHRAYRILAGLVSLAGAYLLTAFVFEGLWLPTTFTGWLVAGLGFWGLVITLPSDVVYWTESDLPVVEAREERAA